MNGAENLLNTLVASGVEVCFANPGTSEMQLVSAIGNSQEMRAVLCLFEGVVSGAADGYARMADKPALTLLHLGSGFANSMANQHNAMRANVPLVNMVGDHATYHLKYDAPLTSDVAAHARIYSSWVRASESANDLALAGAQAVQASMKGAGKIASLIAPANHAWEDAHETTAPFPVPTLEKADESTTTRTLDALSNGKRTVLFLGGRALRQENLQLAAQVAAHYGADVFCECFPARLQRGEGRVRVNRLAYFAEQASEQLKDFEQMILIGTGTPVSFFAYPGKASTLTAQDCEIHLFCDRDHDIRAALENLLRLSETSIAVEVVKRPKTLPMPSGELTPAAIGQVLFDLIPQNAIVSDEAATCGLDIFPYTEQARAHDWLTLTGGAIGQGLPLSLGAAIACPDRKVIALQADGSAMYTLQALWTMAREKCDVTVVIMNNRSYAILNIELARVGAGKPSEKTLSMLDLSNPNIDWQALATGMGIPASRADSVQEFYDLFSAAMQRPGPQLIELMVVQEMP